MASSSSSAVTSVSSSSTKSTSNIVSAGGAISKPLVKPVFSSPGQIGTSTANKLSSGVVEESEIDKLINKHCFKEDIEKAFQQMKKEEHEKRIKNLRKELDNLAETNWMYDSQESPFSQVNGGAIL